MPNQACKLLCKVYEAMVVEIYRSKGDIDGKKVRYNEGEQVKKDKKKREKEKEGLPMHQSRRSGGGASSLLSFFFWLGNVVVGFLAARHAKLNCAFGAPLFALLIPFFIRSFFLFFSLLSSLMRRNFQCKSNF